MALDPRVKTMMWLARRLKRNFRPDLTVEQLRRSYAQSNRQYGLRGTTGVATRELAIPASDGATIGARLYVPGNGGPGPVPVLVFFHGGGFVIGDVACYDGLTRFLAREGRIAVVSVDYRLGPEHPYPTAFEDAFDARDTRAYHIQNSREMMGYNACCSVCNVTHSIRNTPPLYGFQGR